MKLTKYQSRKVMRELLKNYTPIEVSKRMSYMNVAGVVSDYINLPTAEESLKAIVSHLEDLKECDVCGNVETDEYMHDTETMVNGGIGVICESCMRDAF